MYIFRLTIAVLLLLLAVAPAMAQTVVYVGETVPLTVDETPGDTYQWEIYKDGTVNFAIVPGLIPGTDFNFVAGNAGASVQVVWTKPGIYFFKVTATDITGCASNIKIGMLEVKESLPSATIKPPEKAICVGETATLEISLTATGPWNLTYTDGTSSWTIKDIQDPTYYLRVSPVVPTKYWVTEVSNQYGTNSVPSDAVLLEVNPKPVSSKIYQYEP